MAARKRKVRLDENWRARIQTSMIINRLQDHVVGNIDMESTQIKAAEILLRKTAPDLTSTALSGELSTTLTFDPIRAETLRAKIRGRTS